MKIRVVCPHCRAKYQVREDKVGKKFECRKCGTLIAATPAVDRKTPKPKEIPERIEIDTTPKPVKLLETKPSSWSFFWKLAGIIAGVYVVGLLIGFLYPPFGLTFMLTLSMAGVGLTLFGLVRLFLAMEGQQRFWMTLKILLRFVGLKLFYVDASLWNPLTARAVAWMGLGFVMVIVGFLPASYFMENTRGALQDGIAENEQVMKELGEGDPRSDPTQSLPPDPTRNFDPNRSVPPPGFAPPAGYGFPPPPGMGGYGRGQGMPIKFFYESFEHPRSQIPDRVDEAFSKFRFYQAGTVRIDEKKKLIEFTASYPPDRNETAKIRDAYAEAGVKLQPR